MKMRPGKRRVQQGLCVSRRWMPVEPTWGEGRRRAVLFAASLVVAAAILVAKWLLLGPFIASHTVGSALALSAIGAVALVGVRELKLEWSDAALAIAPAAALVLVCVMNTPMAYEIESYAEHMPHPAGGTEGDAAVLRPFQARHPTARIEWVYTDGRNATQLTRDLAAELDGEGWDVRQAFLPGENEFGFVHARKWSFAATCNVWDSPKARVACLLTS